MKLANPSILCIDHDDDDEMRLSSQNYLHQFVAGEWCGGLMRDKDYFKLEASSTMSHF